MGSDHRAPPPRPVFENEALRRAVATSNVWQRRHIRAGVRLRDQGRRFAINLNGRWFAEFDTENQVQGNAVFASLTVRLHVFAPPTPPKVTK